MGQVQRAGDGELVRARTVVIGLRGFYGLYVLHGLLLPDTPAQAALRRRIDDLGVFPLLDHVIAVNPSPRQFAELVVVCLEPFYDYLYESSWSSSRRTRSSFVSRPMRRGSSAPVRPGWGPCAICRSRGGTAALAADLVDGQLKDLEEVGTRPGRFARCRG
ncbi:hypothetical protein [Streptomyces albogriseolus]|uniref:hypothetical protein n=1 Tax=Streptomyces albogriseolus TaxID=1887 RepID=UPI00225676A3|nr:hypothetical protein [Streptomyces viridodiastaticus]MCX4624997.1 hypothetical protein [Streptomyces viridodiastaticus]